MSDLLLSLLHCHCRNRGLLLLFNIDSVKYDLACRTYSFFFLDQHHVSSFITQHREEEHDKRTANDYYCPLHYSTWHICFIMVSDGCQSKGLLYSIMMWYHHNIDYLRAYDDTFQNALQHEWKKKCNNVFDKKQMYQNF